MIVVSDTSALNYLAIIGKAAILHELFGEVIVPMAVARELRAEKTPKAARDFIESPPSWALIRSPKIVDPALPARLGAGELEAISLALELKADLLLCDDEKARKSAMQRAVRVMGTLGVVQLAAAKGLVNFAACVRDLEKTTLRLPNELVAELLRQDAAKDKTPNSENN